MAKALSYFTDASICMTPSGSIGIASMIVVERGPYGRPIQRDQRVVRILGRDISYLEATAILMALEYAHQQPTQKIYIYSDSLEIYKKVTSLLDAASGKSSTPKWVQKKQLKSYELLSIDIAMLIDEYQEKFGQVEYSWCKGHCSDVYEQIQGQRANGFSPSFQDCYFMTWGNARADEWAHNSALSSVATSIEQYQPPPFFINPFK